MRIKTPAQPLVFRYSGVSGLCAAAGRLYGRRPALRADLCLYRGSYYLAVHSPLRARCGVIAQAGRYGAYLGPWPVFYAFCAEHGRPISKNAVEDLGRLFQ